MLYSGGPKSRPYYWLSTLMENNIQDHVSDISHIVAFVRRTIMHELVS